MLRREGRISDVSCYNSIYLRDSFDIQQYKLLCCLYDWWSGGLLVQFSANNFQIRNPPSLFRFGHLGIIIKLHAVWLIFKYLETKVIQLTLTTRPSIVRWLIFYGFIRPNSNIPTLCDDENANFIASKYPL